MAKSNSSLGGVQRSQDNVRVYDIKKVRSALGSFEKEELRNIFLTIHASTKREKTLESQNFYYKGQKANCPITEDLC